MQTLERVQATNRARRSIEVWEVAGVTLWQHAERGLPAGGGQDPEAACRLGCLNGGNVMGDAKAHGLAAGKLA